jgi:hypothetical protein
VVESLPRKCKVLTSNFSTQKEGREERREGWGEEGREGGKEEKKERKKGGGGKEGGREGGRDERGRKGKCKWENEQADP